MNTTYPFASTFPFGTTYPFASSYPFAGSFGYSNGYPMFGSYPFNAYTPWFQNNTGSYPTFNQFSPFGGNWNAMNWNTPSWNSQNWFSPSFGGQSIPFGFGTFPGAYFNGFSGQFPGYTPWNTIPYTTPWYNNAYQTGGFIQPGTTTQNGAYPFNGYAPNCGTMNGRPGMNPATGYTGPQVCRDAA